VVLFTSVDHQGITAKEPKYLPHKHVKLPGVSISKAYNVIFVYMLFCLLHNPGRASSKGSTACSDADNVELLVCPGGKGVLE